MLYYDIIYVNERTDPTKSNRSKEYMICHYWFFNHGFEFQNSVRNDLTKLSVSINDIVIITIKIIDYRCIIHKIS